MISKELERQLSEFVKANGIREVGSLGTCLLLTHKAQKWEFPKVPTTVLTESAGQVSGLGGKAINKILGEHGVAHTVGTESGRTSRGTPQLAKKYVEWLNQYGPSKRDLAAMEGWWIDRFKDYFATEPFKLKYDAAKTLAEVFINILQQAQIRQQHAGGSSYVGTVLQHLVGAKLELAMPSLQLKHHGASVADHVSARSGDFVIDDAVVHCTTLPGEPLLRKCQANIESGLRPIVLTLGKMIPSASQLAENIGIHGQVEILDVIQFLTANLYEMSLFNAADRKIKLDAVIDRYSEIVLAHESNQSLRIEK